MNCGIIISVPRNNMYKNSSILVPYMNVSSEKLDIFDILIIIFSHLSSFELFKCMQVKKRWKNIILATPQLFHFKNPIYFGNKYLGNIIDQSRCACVYEEILGCLGSAIICREIEFSLTRRD